MDSIKNPGVIRRFIPLWVEDSDQDLAKLSSGEVDFSADIPKRDAVVAAFKVRQAKSLT